MAHPLSLQTRSLLAAGIALAAFLGLAFFALDKAFFDAALSSQRERLQGYLHAYLAGADTNRAGNLIPPEACYLGWQESLTQLGQLVGPVETAPESLRFGRGGTRSTF